MQTEYFPCFHPPLVAEQLRQIAKPPPRCEVTNMSAEYPTLARRGLRQPDQQLDRGRLAGAVRSEKSEDLGATHAHGQTGERDRLPIPLGKVLGVDSERGGVGRLFWIQMSLFSGGTLQWRALGLG